MAGREKEPPATPEAAAGDEGFLNRWSRRKAEARTTDDVAPAETRDGASEEAITEAGQDDGGAIDPATLPDIDSLGPGSDFSVFMQAGVPPSLKTRALRRLWQVKPELANLDGLIDYGEDLTGSFKAVDHLKTAYEVGRGFLKRADEALARREEDGTGEAGGEATGEEPKPLESPEDGMAPEAATDDSPASASGASKDKA